MNLLDPRFNYIPAAATDVASTWKRFGFDPKVNKERRRALLNKEPSQAPQAQMPPPSPAVPLSLVHSKRA